MRIAPLADDLLEWVALRLNLAPVPLAASVYGMPAARSLAVAQRVGLLGRLARGPATPEALAGELGLQPVPTRLLLEALVGARHVSRGRDGRYRLHRRARRWLDPASPTSVAGYLDHTADYWAWWGELERVLRDGHSVEIHDAPAGDPSWRRYITGQHELARLSAGEVAAAIELPEGARSVLDLAGAHGTFAAALCRRHPGLRATVVDLPGSTAVGREIVAASGMADRVAHVDGDMFEADLRGPHDAVLCFDIVHHLRPDDVVRLFGRARAGLRPGGTLAVLDLFRSGRRRPRASAAFLGLFFHLTSGADLHSPAELRAYLRAAGFGEPRATRIRRLPDQRLVQAKAV
jgi:SAM-dependent methyltransferase